MSGPAPASLAATTPTDGSVTTMLASGFGDDDSRFPQVGRHKATRRNRFTDATRIETTGQAIMDLSRTGYNGPFEVDNTEPLLLVASFQGRL